MKTEQFLLTVKSSSLYPQLNIEELNHKTKEKLTSLRIRCGFLAKCVFRVLRNCEPCLFKNAEKKLFNSAQAAYKETKIPRDKAKIYQKTGSEL